MKVKPLIAATLVCLMSGLRPCAAYPQSHGPFVAGTEPHRVPLHKCAVIEEAIFDEDQNPTSRIFAVSKRGRGPRVKLQRRQAGWEITVQDRNGAPLIAVPETSEMPSFVHQVLAADLNGDGKSDFVVNIWSGGSGFGGERSTTTFLLSDGNRYRPQSFYGFDFGPEDIVTLRPHGPCYVVHTDLISADFDETKDGRAHDFWVYRLYRIDGSKLVDANGDGKQFPKWICDTRKPNHRETDLLNAEQKKRLLRQGWHPDAQPIGAGDGL
jgi:hypothetical protein